MVNLFNLPEKSHIRDSSLYDNIWFKTEHVTEYAASKGIDRFDEILFGDDDNAANLAVSDHRPVWAEFYTDKDDDGLAPAGSTGDSGTGNTTWEEIRVLHQKIGDLQDQMDSLSKRLEALERAIAQSGQPETATAESVEKSEDSQPADDDVTVYITRTGSKYHRAGCSYLRGSAIPMKKSEAVRRGYTPCSRCRP